MAEFISRFTGANIQIGLSDFAVSNTQEETLTAIAEGDFDVDDVVELYNSDGDLIYSLNYYGHTDSGWIGVLFGGPESEYYYFSTEEIASSTPIPYSTGVFVTCFLEAVRIACPEGERAVEEIAIGDLVLTASGMAKPVRWIGRQTVRRPFADPLLSYPIRISTGALGGGLPKQDLFVSPSHAVLLDGVLAQARVLVNGTSICQVRPRADCFTYYHLEFEQHELVLAEGAPAESFADSNAARARFDNYAEFAELYGTDALVAEAADLPRITCARQLPRRIRAEIARFGADWAQVPVRATISR